MTRFTLRGTLCALSTALLPAAGWALCTSDGVAPPQAVLERFIPADCEACWRDPQTPDAAAGSLALDWVVPGRQGDDAPLAAVASSDALERLQALGRSASDATTTVTTLRQAGSVRLRVAQGAAFNDYIGASIDLRPAGRGPWNAWLLLVESLPAGTEGSPVARNLVRNVFRPAWDAAPARGPGAARRAETRSMQIHAGAQADRLRLVALLQDAQGRMRAIAQTVCTE